MAHFNSCSLESLTSLRALEDEAWCDTAKRQLYSTPHIPGFPWFTTPTTTTTTMETTAVHQGSEDSTTAHQKEQPFPRRHVIPYDFTFKVYVKGRWVGKSLLSVYTSELAHHGEEYYRGCIAAGRLRFITRKELVEISRREVRQQRQQRGGECDSDDTTTTGGAAVNANLTRRNLKRALGNDGPTTHSGVDDNKTRTASTNTTTGTESTTTPNTTTTATSLTTVLQHGDIVLHTTHRHEIPVALGTTGFDPIILLSVCIDALGLITVHKPTGVPTHATGRYNYNSLIAIVEYVLAPRRLGAWLKGRDPLLQSLVDSSRLTEAEVSELYTYYTPQESISDSNRSTRITAHSAEEEEEDWCVSLDKAPRPCHRLDMVTSGVLLLGVSKEAAHRVGAALMAKSKAMDEQTVRAMVNVAPHAIQSPTPSPSSRGENNDLCTGGESSLLHDVLTRDYGLRKRYLAKVVGAFPDASDRLRASLDASVLSDHNDSSNDADSSGGRVGGAFFSAARLPIDTMKALNGSHGHDDGGGSGAENFHQFGGCTSGAGGVLIASDVTNLKMPAAGGGGSEPSEPAAEENAAPKAETNGSDNSSNSKREAVTNTAATVFQPIGNTAVGSVSAGVTAGPCTSLLQCIPFTGRLHQIRIHLSDWGFPIVGDAAHGYRANDGIIDHERVDGGVRDGGVALYFNASDLPQSYRVWRASNGSATTSTGCSGTITEDPAAQCYECSHKLPIATIDKGTSSSAIYLHAWCYELGTTSTVTVRDDAHGTTGGAGAAAGAQPLLSRLPASEFVSVSAGGRVSFRAPLPSWAVE